MWKEMWAKHGWATRRQRFQPELMQQWLNVQMCPKASVLCMTIVMHQLHTAVPLHSVFFFFNLNCDAIRNSHLTAWVTSVSVEAECKQCEPFRPGLQQILRLGHAAIDHNHSCSESMTCCEHLSKLLSLIVTNEKKATFLHKSWGQSKPSNSLHAAKENKKNQK